MTRELVIDACCILNVLASRIEVDIVRANDLKLIISDRAHGETLFLHSPPDDDGLRLKRPASTKHLRAAGHLEIRALDTAALVDAFIECAAQLRDADASCVALAGVLDLPLVTDDGKEKRVAQAVFPKIEILSTLSILHDTARVLNLSDDDLLRLATNLRWGGNFAPPRRDPLASWYAGLLRRAGEG
jgi:predicted PhzF superfamily epimerase YddE/YHI9